jgi:hypothetical protein
VDGDDEGEINNLKSHKKPYASRMVLSNKKQINNSSVKKEGAIDAYKPRVSQFE